MVPSLTGDPLGGLHDPERFRAWVISIAYRQMQDRGRTIQATPAGPPVEDVSEWPDPGGDFVDSTLFRLYLATERREAHEASRWLSDEDQRVLRLWWREAAGVLSRSELAAALGLPAGHAAVKVQRTKARLALARTALRAWRASPRCRGLTAAARGLGLPDRKWFERVGRHARHCDTCSAYAVELVPAEQLLAGGSVAPLLVGAAVGAASVLTFAVRYEPYEPRSPC